MNEGVYTEADIKRITPLEAITLRPRQYWPDAGNDYYSLVAYLSGYQRAHPRGVHPHPSEELILLPEDFDHYVASHVDPSVIKDGCPTKSWYDVIENATGSPEEAMALFTEIRLKYPNKA